MNILFKKSLVVVLIFVFTLTLLVSCGQEGKISNDDKGDTKEVKQDNSNSVITKGSDKSTTFYVAPEDGMAAKKGVKDYVVLNKEEFDKIVSNITQGGPYSQPKKKMSIHSILVYDQNNKDYYKSQDYAYRDMSWSIFVGVKSTSLKCYYTWSADTGDGNRANFALCDHPEKEGHFTVGYIK